MAGQPLTITGENFKPGTTATFTLHSDPVVLGRATVAADGTVSLTATVPANVPAGQHSVVISGTDVSGEAVEVSIQLTVTAPVSSPAATTPETSASTSASTTASANTPAAGDLANTGFNMVPLGLAGAVLVLLGGLVVVRRASVRGARH
ncbi:LPXTG cell wall anchor domain-containing protein [Arthrobacter sp.]|uniref:LPXTG cell wall anchor domain-containing protein n=1 Tax=Arthrobacter sp. TaxID=1667 RepID=UPI0026DFEFDE|nr:LPXTG cell wall anchor domain-containing protein [Arthrobacter sp.]MDO5754387.1 LPXTG cell wall anchor domain-containing protein [Arthrobacter sp.]